MILPKYQQPKAIQIILDVRNPDFPIFVELEDHLGYSLPCSSLIKEEDGKVRIIITEEEYQRLIHRNDALMDEGSS